MPGWMEPITNFMLQTCSNTVFKLHSLGFLFFRFMFRFFFFFFFLIFPEEYLFVKIVETDCSLVDWKGRTVPWFKRRSVFNCTCMNLCIYNGLRNLFFGVLHGMLFCCLICGRLYIFELFSFIFIRVLRPSLRPQNYVRCWRHYSSEHRLS